MSLLLTLAASISTLIKRSGMPTATTASSSSSSSSSSSVSADYTTPAITVPPSSDNPYISRPTSPSGTVFIAVGAVVGFILLAFLLFYAVRSFLASKLAKRTISGEKAAYMYTAHNAHSLSFPDTEYRGSVVSVPLLGTGGRKSFIPGGSPIYGELDATSNHDVTQMFLSPTKQVMTHSRQKSLNWDGSVSSASLYGKLGAGLTHSALASPRHSQLVPHLYLNNKAGESAMFSVDSSQIDAGPSNEPLHKRKTVPSMYLDDLIDK